ncbi:MAG: hypothetical protein ACRDQ4_08145 [Pseudonocardiaceae bacterium]
MRPWAERITCPKCSQYSDTVNAHSYPEVRIGTPTVAARQSAVGVGRSEWPEHGALTSPRTQVALRR